MNIKEYIKNNILILDGAFGTELVKLGLNPGEAPESWNITHPEEVTAIHKAYLDAGSEMIVTNTFGVNGLKYSDEEIEKLVFAAVNNAKKAISEASDQDKTRFIALDIGPTGRMIKPYGDLEFEDAVEALAKTVRAGEKCGVDCVFIETFNDCYETKAAILAAKENSSLPVFVSNAYSSDGRLISGTTPEAMAVMAEGLGADAVGCNCSLGPATLLSVVERLLSATSLPVLFKPNAGLPRLVKGITSYDCGPALFSEGIKKAVIKGATICGGCCGTDPVYIEKLAAAVKGIRPAERNITCFPTASSGRDILSFDSPVIIGERLNPTGKKALKNAIVSGDISYLLSEALSQEKSHAMALDVNVGVPGINEAEVLPNVIREIQSVTSLPLCIDTSSAEALESALRIYRGKAIVNSVNGKKESLDSVLPLVKKYGGVLIALTLDEKGVPSTAASRLKIAKRILKEAEKYGIGKNSILFDPLAMAVSADPSAGEVTLETIRLLHKEGLYTVLGVSNVSFGLPKRSGISSVFLTLALASGLNAAIINPLSGEMLNSYYSFRALRGLDRSFTDYISFAEGIAETVPAVPADATLESSIESGLKEEAARITNKLMESASGLEIINGHIIPALDKVGLKFEKGIIYLPQLLMAAEAATSSFNVIKAGTAIKKENGKLIVLATVHGDIHDIGKNIVKLLLESYGFNVLDLGKDVPPETVAEAVVKNGAKLLGLSALMTTTLKAMEETIKIVKKVSPETKIIVGGAVLTEEFAKSINADYYAKDAMETVRIASM